MNWLHDLHPAAQVAFMVMTGLAALVLIAAILRRNDR